MGGQTTMVMRMPRESRKCMDSKYPTDRHRTILPPSTPINDTRPPMSAGEMLEAARQALRHLDDARTQVDMMIGSRRDSQPVKTQRFLTTAMLVLQQQERELSDEVGQ